MTTQVIFRIDKKVKDRAMRRAKSLGVPLASYFKAAARAFADGHASMDIMLDEQLNAKTRRELEAIHRDIKKGRNLSPGFTSVEEMKRYLRRAK